MTISFTLPPSLSEGFVYLAGPYFDNNPNKRNERARKHEQAAAILFSQGFMVYSPIAAWHTVALSNSLPKDFSFWERQDLYFVSLACALIRYELEGWEKSRGTTAEVKYAQSLGKPIYRLDADVTTLSRLD